MFRALTCPSSGGKIVFTKHLVSKLSVNVYTVHWLRADCSWVVNATLQPLYPRERPGAHCIRGWVGFRAGLDGCGKYRPNGILSPDRPARSESLYRLSYRGPPLNRLEYIYIYGFGGLVVSMLCSGTQVCGFKPGRSRWILTSVKILSMPSSGGEVTESVPYPSFAACQRT